MRPHSESGLNYTNRLQCFDWARRCVSFLLSYTIPFGTFEQLQFVGQIRGQYSQYNSIICICVCYILEITAYVYFASFPSFLLFVPELSTKNKLFYNRNKQRRRLTDQILPQGVCFVIENFIQNQWTERCWKCVSIVRNMVLIGSVSNKYFCTTTDLFCLDIGCTLGSVA